MLALARRSLIFEATAFSFGSLLGSCISITLCHTVGELTVPVFCVMAARVGMTILLTTFVLFKCARLLNKAESDDVQGAAFIAQVCSITESELESRSSSGWIIANAPSPLLSGFLDFEGGPKEPIPGPTGKALYDIRLRRLVEIVSQLVTGPTIFLHCGLGYRAKEGEGAISFRGAIPQSARNQIQRCFIWETPSNDDHALLNDLKDQVVGAINSGEIGQLETALGLCRKSIATLFDLLTKHGNESDPGINEFAVFRKSVSAIRAALEEAVKSGRGDVASKAAYATSECLRLCVRAKNKECTHQIAQHFMLVRNAVRRAQLSNHPEFEDLHWRPLREAIMAISSELSESDQSFMPTLLGVCEDVMFNMLKDCLEEGGEDLEKLINARRLVVGESAVIRPRTSKRFREEAGRDVTNVRWFALYGWALHLTCIGRISSGKLAQLLSVIGVRLSSPAILARTASLALSHDFEDRFALESWVLWSTPENEGRVIVGGVTSQIHEAFTILLLVLTQSSPEGNISFGTETSRASELLNGSSKVLENLGDPESSLRKLLLDAKVLSEPIEPSISTCLKVMESAKRTTDDSKRAKIRSADLSQERVSAFTATIRTRFQDESFFAQIPDVALITDDTGVNSAEFDRLGYNKLVPKAIFIADDKTYWSGFEDSFVSGLTRGEQKNLLEKFAKYAERVETKVNDLLDALVELARKNGTGSIVVQGAATKINVFSHPEFQYCNSGNSFQMGTLANVPISYGFGIKSFSAIYLPNDSVKLMYEPTDGQPGEAISIQVEAISEDRAREIVSNWKENDISKFATGELFDSEVVRVQEQALVNVSFRPVASCTKAIVFITNEQVDDLDYDDE